MKKIHKVSVVTGRILEAWDGEVLKARLFVCKEDEPTWISIREAEGLEVRKASEESHVVNAAYERP